MLDEMDKARQPTPDAETAKEIEFRGAAAKVAETEASAQLKQAQAHKAMQPEAPDIQAPEQQEPFAAEQAMADIENTEADTDLKRANTARAVVQTRLAPMQAAQKAQADRQRLQSRQPQQPAA